jgi:hypothetical protein
LHAIKKIGNPMVEIVHMIIVLSYKYKLLIIYNHCNNLFKSLKYN